MIRSVGGTVRLSEAGNAGPKNAAEKGEVKRTGIEYDALNIPRQIDRVRGKIGEKLSDISDSNANRK